MGEKALETEALKVGELARRTGLTVRTLHHYDEIGLLRPSLHTPAGHRLYAAAEITRLQQVLSLRQLGFSLEEIRDALGRSGYSVREVIELHLARLKERVELQRRLAVRLETLASRLDATGEVSVDELLRAMEEMTMMEKMYSPEQMRQFQEVAETVGREEIEAVEQGLTALLADVRANRELDPASPEARELARRWDELTERTMRGWQSAPELRDAIAENYEQGKFEGADRAPQAADFAFIQRVKEAGAGR